MPNILTFRYKFIILYINDAYKTTVAGYNVTFTLVNI